MEPRAAGIGKVIGYDRTVYVVHLPGPECAQVGQHRSEDCGRLSGEFAPRLTEDTLAALRARLAARERLRRTVGETASSTMAVDEWTLRRLVTETDALRIRERL